MHQRRGRGAPASPRGSSWRTCRSVPTVPQPAQRERSSPVSKDASGEVDRRGRRGRSTARCSARSPGTARRPARRRGAPGSAPGAGGRCRRKNCSTAAGDVQRGGVPCGRSGRRRSSTRATTSASRPRPAQKVNQRSSGRAEPDAAPAARSRSASSSCAGRLDRVAGQARARGRRRWCCRRGRRPAPARPACGPSPSSPLTTSLTVPSPPRATTRSSPSARPRAGRARSRGRGASVCDDLELEVGREGAGEHVAGRGPRSWSPPG